MWEVTIEKISQYRNQIIEMTGKFQYFVAVDVGGTNTRVVFGFPDGRMLTVTKFLASDVTVLLNGLTAVADQTAECLGHVQAAAAVVDVAGPVTENGSKAELTNYSTTISGQEGVASRILVSAQLPSSLFPPGKTRFLNDLEAACFGLMKLSGDGHIEDYFVPLCEGKGERNIKFRPGSTYVVCSVGTGLGSGVIKYVTGRMHEVIPLEAGHCTVTPYPPNHPLRKYSERVNTYLAKRLYNDTNDVEWEDVCSGRGIGNCFSAFEYLKTGKEVPLPGHAPVIAGRALTAQVLMSVCVMCICDNVCVICMCNVYV